MIAVNYTQFRNEMKRNMDLVTDGFETLIVAVPPQDGAVDIKDFKSHDDFSCRVM